MNFNCAQMISNYRSLSIEYRRHRRPAPVYEQWQQAQVQGEEDHVLSLGIQRRSRCTSVDQPRPAAKKFLLTRRCACAKEQWGEVLPLLMETGQESAEDLVAETLNYPNVLLNFDPANLILYNKDEPLDGLPSSGAVVIRRLKTVSARGVVGRAGWGEGCTNASGVPTPLAERGARRRWRSSQRGR